MLESGIYSITNVLNGKRYIGSAKSFKKRWNRHLIELRKNVHHNIHLQRSYNKYGENILKFEIVELLPYEKDIIIKRENFYMNFLNSKSEGYNIADASFGDILSNHPEKEIIIEKIRKSINEINENLSEEERKIKYGNTGSLNGMYGKIHSDETKKKISSNNKGNQYAKGSIRSTETRKRLSEIASERTGEKNPFYGKEHSEETKRKIGEKNKGKTPKNAKEITIDGKVYKSYKHASDELDIHSTTIRWRCLSTNEKYSNYFINA